MNFTNHLIFAQFVDDPKFWDGDYILAKNLYDNGSIELKVEKILTYVLLLVCVVIK